MRLSLQEKWQLPKVPLAGNYNYPLIMILFHLAVKWASVHNWGLLRTFLNICKKKMMMMTVLCLIEENKWHWCSQTFGMKIVLLSSSSSSCSLWSSRSLSRRFGDSGCTSGSSSRGWPGGPGSSWWSECCGISRIWGWGSTAGVSSCGIIVVKDMDMGMWTREEPGRAAEPGANWTAGLVTVDMVVRGWAQGR